MKFLGKIKIKCRLGKGKLLIDLHGPNHNINLGVAGEIHTIYQLWFFLILLCGTGSSPFLSIMTVPIYYTTKSSILYIILEPQAFIVFLLLQVVKDGEIPTFYLQKFHWRSDYIMGIIYFLPSPILLCRYLHDNVIVYFLPHNTFLQKHCGGGQGNKPEAC